MLQIETGKDNPVLRTVCEKVKQSEWKKYAKIGKEMIKYIKHPDHMWVGLAAPQVWITKRFLVASLLKDWDDEIFSTILMINPEIIEHSDDTTCEYSEGCLSLPKTKAGYINRYKRIKVEYYDEKMKKKIIWIEKLGSAIVQHEIDHLNGVLVVDKFVK